MNNYIVIEKLNNGSFGTVMKIKNKYTDKLYAVKIENVAIGMLEYEAKIYNILTGINGIPSIKSYKNDGENCFLIMDLMDYNLKQFKLVNYSNKLEYEILCKNVIVSLIVTLEQIHRENILHRDIKPENICFHNNIVKLIDFGLSKLIDNETINNKKIKEIIGTPNYVSKNIINLNQPTKYDDLESLVYIFLYMLIDDKIFKNYICETNNNKKEITCIEKYIDINIGTCRIIREHLDLCRNHINSKDIIYKKLIELYS